MGGGGSRQPKTFWPVGSVLGDEEWSHGQEATSQSDRRAGRLNCFGLKRLCLQLETSVGMLNRPVCVHVRICQTDPPDVQYVRP